MPLVATSAVQPHCKVGILLLLFHCLLLITFPVFCCGFVLWFIVSRVYSRIPKPGNIFFE